MRERERGETEIESEADISSAAFRERTKTLYIFRYSAESFPSSLCLTLAEAATLDYSHSISLSIRNVLRNQSYIIRNKIEEIRFK